MPENMVVAKPFEINAEATVDIDAVSDVSRNELHLQVAKRLAEETLPYVNADDVPAHPRSSFYSKYGKRALDIFLSACALIVLFPVNLILGICTYFDVGRPIFFRQTRIGKDGKPFIIVKFRNMTNETDANGELLPANQRVTKFGLFVRKTSLDELLNFWSIFKGDMSLIGPRPLSPAYMDRYSERHKARHAVRPGLECPLLHKPDRRLRWDDQFENDVYYAENVSLALDIKMIFLLVRMVFDRKSSSMRGAVTRGSFMGYMKNGESVNSHWVPMEYAEDLIQKDVVAGEIRL